MASNEFFPILGKKLATVDNVTTIYNDIEGCMKTDSFDEFKDKEFSPLVNLVNSNNKRFDEHLQEYNKHKENTSKNLTVLQQNSARILQNTKALNKFIQDSQIQMHQREIFVENFVSQVNSNVKIMQAYVERQLLESRIEQEIAQKQLIGLLTLPWYKRFTKKQRSRVLDRIRNEILEEYKELKEAAEKKINEALIQGNITFTTEEGNTDG